MNLKMMTLFECGGVHECYVENDVACQIVVLFRSS